MLKQSPLLVDLVDTDLFLTNDKRLVGKIVPGIQFIASLEMQLF